ncbi:hypothetical protein [Nocardioides sp. YIM 152315]|uniref:hypothetical protein n=1 Tax=Nocardioides sp. YIM 152315 TaxID=3031760 RepID=UPI0023DACB97|nr:hypothetical protein [Nocardioides sp. YIM 152315]MDF1602890.1 hypothetical protein [Nocardioides sp. YIM 152315]
MDASKVPPLLLAVLVALLGVGAAAYGEADDAPGLVLIGGVVVLAALWLGVRVVRR